MKNFSALCVAVCISLVLLTGCGKNKQVEVVGGKVESVSMSGMRNVNLGMILVIKNPFGKLDVIDAGGVFMHFGKVIGRMTLDPFVVNKKTEEEYHVKVNFTLDESLGLMQAMQFLSIDKLSECTVDVYVKAKLAGAVVQKKYENIPMNELFEL